MADPRRKDLVRSYTPVHLTAEELPPDFIAMISLVFGLVGMIAQVRCRGSSARRTGASLLTAVSSSLPLTCRSVVSLPCADEGRKLASSLCLCLLARQRQEVRGGHQADNVQYLVSDSLPQVRQCLARRHAIVVGLFIHRRICQDVPVD